MDTNTILTASDNLATFLPAKEQAKYATLRAAYAQSVTQGYWEEHTSRQLRAALSKKLANGRMGGAMLKALDRLRRKGWEWQRDQPACQDLVHTVDMAATYGVFYLARVRVRYDGQDFEGDLAFVRNAVIDEIEKDKDKGAVAKLFDEIFARRDDAQLVAQTFEALDAQRPKPVFTLLGVSPTITATLQDMGFVKASEAEISMPEIELVPDGGGSWRPTLKWPESTKHNTSRFASRYSCCHACGHRITNAANWVPVVVTSDKQPRSIWVGSDCARSVFGIEAENRVALRDEAGA
jgi:hypothetical protein